MTKSQEVYQHQTHPARKNPLGLLFHFSPVKRYAMYRKYFGDGYPKIDEMDAHYKASDSHSKLVFLSVFSIADTNYLRWANHASKRGHNQAAYDLASKAFERCLYKGLQHVDIKFAKTIDDVYHLVTNKKERAAERAIDEHMRDENYISAATIAKEFGFDKLEQIVEEGHTYYMAEGDCRSVDFACYDALILGKLSNREDIIESTAQRLYNWYRINDNLKKAWLTAKTYLPEKVSEATRDLAKYYINYKNFDKAESICNQSKENAAEIARGICEDLVQEIDYFRKLQPSSTRNKKRSVERLKTVKEMSKRYSFDYQEFLH